MREYIIGSVEEAAAAARAVEEFLLDAQDPEVWNEIGEEPPLAHLPAADVHQATGFASGLVQWLGRLHQVQP